jgi:hypothetical protein
MLHYTWLRTGWNVTDNQNLGFPMHNEDKYAREDAWTWQETAKDSTISLSALCRALFPPAPPIRPD